MVFVTITVCCLFLSSGLVVAGTFQIGDTTPCTYNLILISNGRLCLDITLF